MRKQFKKVISSVLMAAVVLSMDFGINFQSANAADTKVRPSTKKLTINLSVTLGKSRILKVTNTKKTVKWKILSGKKRLTLKKKNKTTVIIKGKKKGKAKVQASVGKKKLLCLVTVINISNKKTTAPKLDETSTQKPKKTVTPTSKPKNTAKPPIMVVPGGEREEEEWDNEAEKYSYEIIPLMAPFSRYFYIKTDNPNPDSFRFVDEDNKYATNSEDTNTGIEPTDTVFSDVKYENEETKRVKDGYIAKCFGTYTDGGELRLQERKVTGTHPVVDSSGKKYYEKDYKCKDTEVTVQIDALQDVPDYLISTYGDSSKTFFDNLSGIQSAFDKECLYSGVYVLGKQKKSTETPYYGLSTSPHADQTFYIQSPYYRSDSKPMLVSYLYPMKYDSLGFPSIIWEVAERLDSTVSIEWSSKAHYLINVTYNGETKTYGGAGSGGGQGINSNQIKYWYSFDGSADDAYMNCNLEDVSSMIREYGELEVPEEPKDQPVLTWKSVRETVGKEGSYVKLTLLTSIYGGTAEGYTFMYDNGSTEEGEQGWGEIGHFSNAWYDGRYFNRKEYYYPGAEFEDTVEKVSPDIILKDVTIKLPDDGRTYYYDYRTMDKVSRYDVKTGVWSGFMKYRYDSESQTWIADILDNIKYYSDDYEYKSIDAPDFIDACTITMDEALAMNLDANTNKEPSSYYIYDQVTSPGTYHSEEN